VWEEVSRGEDYRLSKGKSWGGGKIVTFRENWGRENCECLTRKKKSLKDYGKSGEMIE